MPNRAMRVCVFVCVSDDVDNVDLRKIEEIKVNFQLSRSELCEDMSLWFSFPSFFRVESFSDN